MDKLFEFKQKLEEIISKIENYKSISSRLESLKQDVDNLIESMKEVGKMNLELIENFSKKESLIEE